MLDDDPFGLRWMLFIMGRPVQPPAPDPEALIGIAPFGVTLTDETPRAEGR